uniref:Uncharacterized protein n=1 Tax=viral metagenome TaxID=1070528 RepID=A0A2V0R8X4_9ZZZZ
MEYAPYVLDDVSVDKALLKACSKMSRGLIDYDFTAFGYGSFLRVGYESLEGKHWDQPSDVKPDWMLCSSNQCGMSMRIGNYKFRNELSLKEWTISGMCQVCQDEMYDRVKPQGNTYHEAVEHDNVDRSADITAERGVVFGVHWDVINTLEKLDYKLFLWQSKIDIDSLINWTPINMFWSRHMLGGDDDE